MKYHDKVMAFTWNDIFYITSWHIQISKTLEYYEKENHNKFGKIEKSMKTTLSIILKFFFVDVVILKIS